MCLLCPNSPPYIFSSCDQNVPISLWTFFRDLKLTFLKLNSTSSLPFTSLPICLQYYLILVNVPPTAQLTGQVKIWISPWNPSSSHSLHTHIQSVTKSCLISLWNPTARLLPYSYYLLQIKLPFAWITGLTSLSVLSLISAPYQFIPYNVAWSHYVTHTNTPQLKLFSCFILSQDRVPTTF